MNPNFNYPPGDNRQANYADNNGNNQPPPPPVNNQPTRFEILVKNHEINPIVAGQLHTVLSTTKLVLLCDDSGSMSQPIAEEGVDPFALKRSTRWMQLKKLTASIIQYCSAINPDGLDIHFFNRPSLFKVTSTIGLADVFSKMPSGGTPLCSSLQKLFNSYGEFAKNDKQLLIVVITDGEPSDGSRDDLYNVLIRKDRNIHVSFAECTDNEEDMEYLDQWDGRIPNFDNTDDYRMQLFRIKNTQGQNFKFDYNDYVVKILLATFVRWYFNLDQTKIQDFRNVNQNQNTNQNNNNFSNNNPYQPTYAPQRPQYQQTTTNPYQATNNTYQPQPQLQQTQPPQNFYQAPVQNSYQPRVVQAPFNTSTNNPRQGNNKPYKEQCIFCQLI